MVISWARCLRESVLCLATISLGTMAEMVAVLSFWESSLIVITFLVMTGLYTTSMERNED